MFKEQRILWEDSGTRDAGSGPSTWEDAEAQEDSEFPEGKGCEREKMGLAYKLGVGNNQTGAEAALRSALHPSTGKKAIHAFNAQKDAPGSGGERPALRVQEPAVLGGRLRHCPGSHDTS